jgi:hypothetical protein
MFVENGGTICHCGSHDFQNSKIRAREHRHGTLDPCTAIIVGHTHRTPLKLLLDHFMIHGGGNTFSEPSGGNLFADEPLR